MKTTLRKRPVRDAYLQLVQAFPLRPVRTDADCKQALEVLDGLVLRDDLDPGEQDYVQVLTTLVEKYESKQERLPRAGALDVLRHLMQSRGMTTAALGRVLGHSSLASAILSGKRQISKTHARALSEHFGLDVGAFID